MRPQRRLITTGLLLLLVSMPFELFPAFVWMYVVDALVLQQPTAPSVYLGSIFSLGGRISGWPALLASALSFMLGAYLLYELLATVSRNLMERAAQGMVFDLRNRVYRKLQSQSLGYLQRHRTGDLMSRAVGDVDELQGFTVNGIDVIIGEGLMWFVTVAVVYAIDWRVATASLAPLLLVYFLLKLFNRRVAPLYAAARACAGDVNARVQESLAGVAVIKTFGREQQEADRFRIATRTYRDQQIRAANARALHFPFSRLAGFLTNVSMLGVGGYLILTGGGFTVGKLLMFRAYWWRLFGPIQTLSRVNDMVQRAIASARRVFEVLDAPDELPDAPGAVAPAQVRGALELRNVSFDYAVAAAPAAVRNGSPADKRVLRGVTLNVEPGQTVALCGPSGAGKTTVLHLLLRFYDPTDGHVLLDGIDIRRIRRDSLRSHFALVQQEPFLFDGTILDNVRYARPDAPEEAVRAAISAAHAERFVERLPEGLLTRVGERGVRLSGGQRQRLSIARAFLADPRVLLLDEPTSSVEPESEAAIIAALEVLMAGRTTVFTTHRPSLVARAQVACVIDDGRLVGFGPPADLRRANAWFDRFMSSAEQPEPSPPRGDATTRVPAATVVPE